MMVSQDVLGLFGVKDEATFIQYMQSQAVNTLIEALEISYVELTSDRVIMTMPVGTKTRQPAGILHGGASVALAETAASIATAINVDLKKYNPVGLEINANHIRSKRDGIVTAIATPLHKGRKTMVWDVKIVDEEEKLICVSRCTMAVIAKN